MSVGAIVLAAGSGSRFGSTKQLALVDGKPLVRHAVDAAVGAGITDVVVVVGHDADAVAAAAGDEARVVLNARSAEGQSTSLLAGIEALADDVGAVVVLLADQPGITPDLVAALVEAASHRDEPIVRLRFSDGPGPSLLRRAAWDEVRALEGDVGARELIRRRPDLVFEAVVERPAPPDVDTPADLRRTGGPRPGQGNEKPPSL